MLITYTYISIRIIYQHQMETNDVFITLLPFSYQTQQIPAVS